MYDYQKKDLCCDLLKVFRDKNKNPKENAKNIDKPDSLHHHVQKFRTITALLLSNKYFNIFHEFFIYNSKII